MSTLIGGNHRLRVLSSKMPLKPPRPAYAHQREAIMKMAAWWREDTLEPGVVVLPTGSGKTRTAVEFILTHVLQQRGPQRVVWLTHRQELRNSTSASFETTYPLVAHDRLPDFRIALYGGSAAERWTPGTGDDPHVLVASIQSVFAGITSNNEDLRRVLNLFKKRQLFIVVDECHHEASAPTWQKVISELSGGTAKPPRVLGLSATPARSDYFRRCLVEVSLSEMIEKRILARPICERLHSKVAFTPSGRADAPDKYTSADLLKLGKIAQRAAALVDFVTAHAAELGQTLVFAPSVEAAAGMADALNERRISAVAVDGETDSEVRRAAFERFANNDVQVFCNFGVATEGTDMKNVNTVLLGRPTTSRTLFQQMVGRGLRGPHCGGTETCRLVVVVDGHLDWLGQSLAGNSWGNLAEVLSSTGIDTQRGPSESATDRPDRDAVIEQIRDSIKRLGGQLLAGVEDTNELVGSWTYEEDQSYRCPHFACDVDLHRWLERNRVRLIDSLNTVPASAIRGIDEAIGNFLRQRSRLGPWVYRAMAARARDDVALVSQLTSEDARVVRVRGELAALEWKRLRTADAAEKDAAAMETQRLQDELYRLRGDRNLIGVLVDAIHRVDLAKEANASVSVGQRCDRLLERIESALGQRSGGYALLQTELQNDWITPSLYLALDDMRRVRFAALSIELLNHLAAPDALLDLLWGLALSGLVVAPSLYVVDACNARMVSLQNRLAGFDEASLHQWEAALREAAALAIATERTLSDSVMNDPKLSHARGKLLGTVARTLSFLGDHAFALDMIQRASAAWDDPNDAHFLANMAMNRITAARILAEKARLVGLDERESDSVRAMFETSPGIEKLCLQAKAEWEGESMKIGTLFTIDALLRLALWAPEALMGNSELRAEVLVSHVSMLLPLFREAVQKQALPHPAELVLRHLGELARSLGQNPTPCFDVALASAEWEQRHSAGENSLGPSAENILARLGAFTLHLASGGEAEGPLGGMLNPTFEYR